MARLHPRPPHLEPLTTSAPRPTSPPAHDDPEQDSWNAQVERMDPGDLRLLVASLPVIEQAKGILMGHYGCDAPTAFAVLRRRSSSRNLKVRELAALLVAEAGSAEQGPADDERTHPVGRLLRTHGLD